MSQASLKEALSKTVAGIQQNPLMSRVVFEAETALVEGVCCTGKVRNFAPIVVDEPPELGGQDKGANPVELLLVALGSCQEIMYAAMASMMGIKLDEVKVNLKGSLDLKGLFGMDPAIPPGYQKITYETILKSSAPEEELRKLIDAVETHCPVLDTLVRPIEVTGKVTINGALVPA
ncbi:MAG: OsmC family peroxiredoxin [Rhodocyclaceae bacterium]|nr:MAG: OsmC family peroxiredoxin [Rhodocyclaceae bacterium]